MNKLNEIINREASKFKAPLEADGLNLLIQNVAIEFAKHILKEAAENAESFISHFNNDGEQYCKTEVNQKSITDTLNKYL